jgi:hypothetical protein
VPELYIGNASRQIFQFAYRFPERVGIITQVIPMGGQIRVSPNGKITDLSTLEIDSVVGQHRMYGLVAVDDIDTDRSNFSGLCYSIGKPISIDKLRKAIQRNDDKLKIQGQKMRQEAALAVNAQIEEQIGVPLRQLEMSFTEEEPRSGFAEELDHLAEGVRVTRTEVSEGRRGRK